MKAQVFTNEAGNEVIAMVIAFVAIQSQWITTHLRCSLQRFRLELLSQKVIGFTLIYQRRHKLRGVLHQQAGVIFSPAVGIITQISSECLLSPGAIYRITDRTEGRYRLKALGVAHRQHQSTVTTHRVTKN